MNQLIECPSPQQSIKSIKKGEFMWRLRRFIHLCFIFHSSPALDSRPLFLPLFPAPTISPSMSMSICPRMVSGLNYYHSDSVPGIIIGRMRMERVVEWIKEKRIEVWSESVNCKSTFSVKVEIRLNCLPPMYRSILQFTDSLHHSIPHSLIHTPEGQWR